MSSRQNHIIQRQVLEVNLQGEEEHWQWQERLSRFAREQFAPQMEALLDRHSMPGEVIRIEKLEVTADLPAGENWEKLLLDDLLRKVEQALPVRPFGQAVPLPPGNGVQRVTAAESTLAQFFYFLKNGTLPWQAPAALKRDFETEILKTIEQLDSEMAAGWSQRFRELLKMKSVRRRLALQFSGRFLVKLVSVLLPELAAKIIGNQKLIPAFVRDARVPEPAFRLAFWSFVLEEAAGPAPAAELARRWEEKPLLQSVLQQVFNKKTWTAAIETADVFHPKKSKNEDTAGEPSDAATLPAASQNWYVDNAGLVLLHPFLPAFFEELKVVKKGRILKPQRAVHLLQYLATGQAATPEFGLPLNKLLCGLPLAEPLEAGIRLTKKEKTEAKKLLEAVIRHWSILKNTSPEGLQGTYLCREGKLSKKDSGDWLLQVEQKGFDVLLADLPWSFSMIKLPWMEEVLWVEWQ
jgi:hypothetical protein